MKMIFIQANKLIQSYNPCISEFTDSIYPLKDPVVVADSTSNLVPCVYSVCSRDFAYQALRLFDVPHRKAENGLWDEVLVQS